MRARYDLHNSNVIDDFENWLRERPDGVWYANDCFNCPWRAFVRSKGYDCFEMTRNWFSIGDTSITKFRNPVFAQDFIKNLDGDSIEIFEVSSSDCIKVLDSVRKGNGNG